MIILIVLVLIVIFVAGNLPPEAPSAPPNLTIAPAEISAPAEDSVQNRQLVEPEKSQAIALLPKAASLEREPEPTLANPKKIAMVPEFVFVTGTRVNLRAGPGTSQRILGGFDNGQKLILHESGKDWSRVSGLDGSSPKSGWISSRFLSNAPPASVATQPKQRQRRIAVPSSREVQEAREILINQSIANYSGNCPCPYNRDRANRRCGKRSAWSKPGGAAPLCYDSDVDQSRLTAYFARQGRNWP